MVMSIFAPAYRPKKRQQTLLVRQGEVESRKRKRGSDSSDEDDFQDSTERSPEPDSTARTASTAFHPVNYTDPYFIAGHARELPLPPPPFPHAAVKEARPSKRSIEDELAELNPPLCIPPATEERSTSLRKRHLDNLTTILHKCMLKGDWQRAFRAWGLLIRTEIAGRGIDVRRNGRWSIGAELLMRRNSQNSGRNRRETLTTVEIAAEGEIDEPAFSMEGFKLAREYYERLILQYPHTVRTMHAFNATAVYPALFNIWIYEVQERSKRARRRLTATTSSKSIQQQDEKDNSELTTTTTTTTTTTSPEESSQFAHQQLRQIRSDELQQAQQIAERMDELFLSPPYDTNSELLNLRGMLAQWIADLHDEVAVLLGRELDGEEGGDDILTEWVEFQSEIEGHRGQAEEERRVAVMSLEKAAQK